MIKVLVINFLWSTICAWIFRRRTGGWLFEWECNYLCKSKCVCKLQIWLHFFFRNLLLKTFSMWHLWRLNQLLLAADNLLFTILTVSNWWFVGTMESSYYARLRRRMITCNMQNVLNWLGNVQISQPSLVEIMFPKSIIQ